MVTLAIIAYCALMALICLGGAAVLLGYAIAAPWIVMRRRAKMLRERAERVERIHALELAVILRAERGIHEQEPEPPPSRSLFSFEHDGPRVEPHRIQEN